MNRLALTCIKVLLSIPVGIALAYPLVAPGSGGGVFAEMRMLGPTGALAAAAGFLALVFLYARDLSRSLARVSPASRRATPRSVWLMFLLPYNFIEDFFIIANVARSLRAEAMTNPSLAGFRSFGMAPGIGWCALQLVSLAPNAIGSAAGGGALVLWLWHWVLIRRVNAALRRGRQGDASPAPALRDAA